MYWYTYGTLYSKRENRDYQESALKLETFSASLKLLYIEIQQLSFIEGYAQKNNSQADKKRRSLSPQMKDHIF